MVQIGDLENNSETIKVVTPKFNKEIYQNVAVVGRGGRVDASRM